MVSSSPVSRATASTPTRRPADHTTFSSPRSINLSPYLREDRNSEANHVQQLAAAEESHTRVREAAILAYTRYEQDLERRRVKEQQRLEEERLKAEADLAEEYRRLSILKAKSVPRPPSPKPEEQKPPSPKQARSRRAAGADERAACVCLQVSPAWRVRRDKADADAERHCCAASKVTSAVSASQAIPVRPDPFPGCRPGAGKGR